MSEIIYNLDEVKMSLSQLVDRAARGEEIILCKAGKPLAKLGPYQQNPKPRQPEDGRGQMSPAQRAGRTEPRAERSDALGRNIITAGRPVRAREGGRRILAALQAARNWA
jgi:prevent-host-death family protein